MQDANQMSLRDKVGQMFLCGFEGTEPSAEIEELIRHYRIGGVIYFSRNLENPRQMHALSRSLQSLATAAGSPPLIISIDQEGGMVARITNGVTLMPGNMAMGAAGSAELAGRAAYVSGKELRSLGVNMNFAPCIDINHNPLNPVIGVRSYGEDPGLVGDMGAAAVQGYQSAGVAATVKHFPGHGDTSVDSHLDLPLVAHSKERMEQIELQPFMKAIAAGVDAVMTAHIVFPAYEKERVPSTLSQAVVTGLLRRQLRFDGVVMTDCMEMKAISDDVGTENAAVRAIEAGVDLILVSHRMDRQVGSIDAVLRALETGRISEDRINASVERIVRLKRRRNMDEVLPAWDKVEAGLRTEEHVRLARDISERSVTVVKDERTLLPLTPSKSVLVLMPRIHAVSEVDERLERSDTLGSFLSETMEAVSEAHYSTDPGDEEILQLLERCGGYDQIVACTYNAAFHPGQCRLLEEVVQCKAGQLVLVSLRNPYDLAKFPGASAMVACYESRPLALRSAAKVLTGQTCGTGRLPVNIHA